MNLRTSAAGAHPLQHWFAFAAGMIVALPGSMATNGGDTSAPSRSGWSQCVTLAGHTDASPRSSLFPGWQGHRLGQPRWHSQALGPARGKERATLKIPEAPPDLSAAARLYSAAFAPDGKVVATAGSDGTIRLWDSATAKEVRVIQVHRGLIYSLRFLQRQTLASAGADRVVSLWDVATASAVHAGFAGHRSDIKSVAFSPDGGMVLSGSRDSTVKFWQTDPPNALYVLHARRSGSFCRLCPETTTALSWGWSKAR